MSDSTEITPDALPFQPRCLSIDLEVGLRSGRIRQLAALRGESGESLRFDGGDLAGALGRLDALADGCSFVLGHNFIHFDRPHLAAAQPGLRLLALPVIDTLWLNPLAFPRHPYHHLVKHYQNGGLRRGRLNDPLLDAQLTLLPPWVQHRFPGAGMLIRRLRDQACGRRDCAWCSDHHDASRELTRWFGFTGLRPEPTGADGRPLQQSIVEGALRGEHLLAILPTGTGKSLCYQIPALSRFEKTGALTFVISLPKRWASTCAASTAARAAATSTSRCCRRRRRKSWRTSTSCWLSMM